MTQGDNGLEPTGQPQEPAQPAGVVPPTGAVPPTGVMPPTGAAQPNGVVPQNGAMSPTGAMSAPGAVPPAYLPPPGYVAPSGAAPAPAATKRLGRGALFGIIGGAAAVVIASAVVVVVASSSPGSTSESGVVLTTSTPREAVSGFLKAVAASDSKTALEYLYSEPKDAALLTDKMLKASNKIAPIKKIKVDEPKTKRTGSATVTARFTMGSESVKATFALVEDPDLGWSMTRATQQLGLGHLDDLDITVNGITIKGRTPDVFPGTYRIATPHPSFELTGKTEVSVTGPNDHLTLSGLKAGLNEEGLSTYRTIVKDALSQCLATKTLVAGCGLTVPSSLSDGTQLVEGTITRTLSADGQAKLDSLKPEETYKTPLVVTTYSIGRVAFTAECASGGSQSPCELYFGPRLGAPVVDFSQEKPVLRWGD